MGGNSPPSTPPVPHFNYDRPARDTFWGYLYTLMWALSIAGGVYAIANRNPAFLHLDYTDPASCPYKAPNRRLLEALREQHAGEIDLSAFMHLTGRWLALSALASLALGYAFVHLFVHHAHTMTRVTIGSQVAFPLLLSLLLLAVGQLPASLLLMGFAALTFFVFTLWRREIDLATRLLGVSATALAKNGGIIAGTIALNLASLLAIAPLVTFVAFAVMNGSPVPNPARRGAAECADEQGKTTLCCSWQPDAAAQAYIVVGLVLVTWTMLLAGQIRVFVTSGTVAQWYFAPPSLCAAAPASGALLLSLRHALGPSFGTLCLSSLVLTISQYVRSAMERARRSNSNMGIVELCAIMLAQCFWSLVEYLTKFATVMAAMSGEAFLAAGRHVTDLLCRNLLDAFATTIWFTPLVIQLACVTMSLCWGALSGGAYYVWHAHAGLAGSPGGYAAVLGISSGFISLFVLNFLGGILLSVLDAVFICWAVDRDNQTISHPEVYAVLSMVPLPGAVVEQPDGYVAYGAVPPPTAPPAYQPPSVGRV